MGVISCPYTPKVTFAMSASASKVLLLGWDAADWKVIRPLLAAGQMPHFAGLMARGVHGNLSTLYPTLSPMLWTSIATGKRPPKHGVLGFTEPLPGGGGVCPSNILSRTTKAVWNILAQEGKRSIVVGWWPSYPAEPIPGAVVSNHFQVVSDDPDAELTPLPPGIVAPDSVAEEIADLRVRPSEIPLEVLRMFVPRADEIDQTADKSLHDLAKILAETLSIHAAATDLLERESWDFAAVYFDAVDHASHRFMKCHPPRLKWVPEQEYELYKDVVANVYRHHDAMLGRYLELAGPDAHVLVISDHGFHSDELRPKWIAAEPAGPAAEHRHFGIAVMAGPGIRAGERIHGSSVLDVTPTLLTLFGLPVGADMDGTPQVQAWETPPEVRRIPSWDDVPGADGRHPPETQHDPRAAAAQLEQLVALGYVAPMPDDKAQAVRETVRELDYNFARALDDGGRTIEAIPILERLWDEWPDEHRFGFHLLEYQASTGRVADRRRTLDTLRDRAERFAAEAVEKLAALPEEDRSTADPIAARTEVGKRKQHEHHRLVELSVGLNLGRVTIQQALLENDTAAATSALEPLLKADAEGRRLPFPLASFVAATLVELNREAEALPILDELLKAEPESPPLETLRAGIYFRKREWDKVVESASEALGLVYFNPRLHMLLGMALARLDRKWDAINELLVAVRQSPTLIPAWHALERLHAHDPERAAEFSRRRQSLRAQLVELRRTRAAPPPTEALLTYDFTARCAAAASPGHGSGHETIIVSGLPRSGTSMLMRVLGAGGVPLFVDGERGADENNRLGYFEFEPVKELGRGGDMAWTRDAIGKAIKVVAPLLRHLPAAMPARILLLHRPLAQVLGSQEAMKERLGTTARGVTQAILSRQFAAEMEAIDASLAARPAWQVLHVGYENMLADPAGECRRISAFLGNAFDWNAAARGVDASQRRFS